MDINFSITPTAASFTQKVLFVLYEASAPNTIIDHIERDPSVDPMNLIFYDKRFVAHIVKTYDSPGWPVLGTYKMGWVYQAQPNKDEVKGTDFLIMDGGGDTYTDPLYNGWEIDFIQRRGEGCLYPGLHVNYNDDGFTILDKPAFDEGEMYDVHFLPRTTQADPINPPGGGMYAKDITLTSDYTVNPANDKNALFICSGVGGKQTVTLPALSAVADGTIFGFSSFINNLSIVTVGSDKMSTPRNLGGAMLCGFEQITIMKAVSLPGGPQWIVCNQSPTVLLTGTIMDCYVSTGSNFVWANGTEVNRADYSRLWAWVQAQPDILIDKSTWTADTTQQAKYHRGDGSTTFGLPLLYMVSKGVDGSARKAASFQDSAMQDHKHFAANTDTGEGAIDANSSIKYSKDNGQRNAYILSGSVTVPTIGLTSGVNGGASSETLVKNFGVYKKIMI